MIAVSLTFRYGAEFNADALRRIALETRSKFDGMTGLHSKAYTVDEASREAQNFYVWDSVEAANGFFTDANLAFVATLYGVKPEIRYREIAALVDNVG